MKSFIPILAALALAGCATQREAHANAAMLARGQHIAETICATCHAVGRTGESPAPQAPPFRTLSRNYPIDSLEEALAEGISVGHPMMPHFEFSGSDVTAVVSYLQSIQERPQADR